MLTAQDVRSLLKYDAATGVFHWIEPGKGRPKDLKAGRISSRGYAQICIDYKKHAAHRVAWLYVYGQWPTGDLDHINGVRHDNRLENLRPATDSQNAGNRKRPVSNKSGFKGVYKSSSNRWRAQIKVNGTQRVLGHFSTPEEGHAAYVQAAKEVWGEFARAGR